MKKALLTLIVCLMAGISAVAQSDGDKIIGTYKAVQDGNVSKVKISKNGDGYKAQIIWLEHPNNADGTPKLDKKNPDKALTIADNLVGSWNTFRVKMVGEKVWVWLNGQLVVDNTTLENYWDRSRSIFPVEQIELQCHGDPVEFRNIFIKEL